MDDKNTHTLWRDAGGGWSRPAQAASEKGEPNQVFFSQWLNPNNPEGKDCHFLTGGNSLQFWKLDGANLSKKNGRFGAKYKQVCMRLDQTRPFGFVLTQQPFRNLQSYACSVLSFVRQT